MLTSHDLDLDCRHAAADTLTFIEAPEVPALFREAHARTGDPFLQELLDDL